MLSRYKKIKEDSRFPAAEDKRQYPFCDDSAAKLLSSFSFYLHLSPSISFYLHLSPSIFIYLLLFTKQAELAKVELNYNKVRVGQGKKMEWCSRCILRR